MRWVGRRMWNFDQGCALLCVYIAASGVGVSGIFEEFGCGK